MNKQLHFLKMTRQHQIKLIQSQSLDQLNIIPEGLNNNLIWNFAHTMVTQQLMCYRLAGLEPDISDDLINAYRNGTKPEGAVDQSFVDMLVQKALSTAEKTATDYQAGVFKQFKSYTTGFGATMNSVEDAMMFDNIHEAMHLGTMSTYRVLLKKG